MYLYLPFLSCADDDVPNMVAVSDVTNRSAYVKWNAEVSTACKIPYYAHSHTLHWNTCTCTVPVRCKDIVFPMQIVTTCVTRRSPVFAH